MIEFEKMLSLGTMLKPSLSSDRSHDFTDLWLYGIEEEFARNSRAIIRYGDYSNPSFLPLAAKITSSKVTDIRVKSLSGYGSYGYYTLKKPNVTYLQMPFHINVAEEEKPAVAFLYTPGNLKVSILAASAYDCYRIRITKGDFVQDKIAYVDDRVAEVNVRTAAALPFEVTIIGYKNELSAVSIPSLTTLYDTKPSYVSSAWSHIANSTSRSCSISTAAGNFVIAFATTRHSFSSSPGWAYTFHSKGAYNLSTTVYIKEAASPTETFEVSADTSGIIGITLLAVKDLHDISCLSNYSVLDMLGGYKVRRVSDPTIYFMSSALYSGTPTLTIDPAQSTQAIQANYQQLIFDASDDEEHTITTTDCSQHEFLTFALT